MRWLALQRGGCKEKERWLQRHPKAGSSHRLQGRMCEDQWLQRHLFQHSALKGCRGGWLTTAPPTPAPQKHPGSSGRCSYPAHREVDIRLPGKGNSTSHGARSTKIISMIQWIQTSGLSIKKSFSGILPSPTNRRYFPRETGILWSNSQRQHYTSHAPKNVCYPYAYVLITVLRGSRSCELPRERWRVLHWQPTGPSPPHRLDDLVDLPCAMGVLNFLFHAA